MRLRRIDHQMDIEDFLGARPDALDHRWPERQIGHEMTVHDVDMDIIASGVVDGLDLGA